MKKMIFSGALFRFSFLFLSLVLANGCGSVNIAFTPAISGELQPKKLRTSFEVKPLDLRADSKCESQTTVSVINVEKNDQDMIIQKSGTGQFCIKPKTLNEMVAVYMRETLQFCHIKVSQVSSRKILLSLPKVEMNVPWYSFGPRYGAAQLLVEIPEIGFSRVYTTEDHTAEGANTAVANALHLAVWQCINDPEVQAYLQCR
jgi:hypothetical protein